MAFFANPAVSFVIVSLNILAGIAQFLFFYKLKSSTSGNGIFFGIAGWAGMIGSLINILPKMLALSVLLQFYFSFNLLKESQLIAVLSPWLGSVLLLCCCLLFSLLTAKIWATKTRVFLVGAIGYMILAVTFSMLVVHFFSDSQFNWRDGEISASIEYFIISASLSYFCIAYFFAGFFGDNGDIGNESR